MVFCGQLFKKMCQADCKKCEGHVVNYLRHKTFYKLNKVNKVRLIIILLGSSEILNKGTMYETHQTLTNNKPEPQFLKCSVKRSVLSIFEICKISL
jgi:hypothetical protein